LAEDGFEFVDATMIGRTVLVLFRQASSPDVYAVELDAASPLSGASTGEVCSTVKEWAKEVHWLLDEEIGTGDLWKHPREVTPDGIVLVHVFA
jgi:hypothetical protein